MGGGLGREVADIARRINSKYNYWDRIIFIDDTMTEGFHSGLKILNFNSISHSPDDYEIVIAIGEPSSRAVLLSKVKSKGFTLATLIDPTSIISETAKIGQGTVICEFVTIHTNVVIGESCYIQPYSCIGHDIVIGDNCILSTFFAPGGNCIFGNNIFVGMSSSIKQKLTIGSNSIIAMGSSVFNNVDENSVLVGNPARITKGNGSKKVFK